MQWSKQIWGLQKPPMQHYYYVSCIGYQFASRCNSKCCLSSLKLYLARHQVLMGPFNFQFPPVPPNSIAGHAPGPLSQTVPRRYVFSTTLSVLWNIVIPPMFLAFWKLLKSGFSPFSPQLYICLFYSIVMQFLGYFLKSSWYKCQILFGCQLFGWFISFQLWQKMSSFGHLVLEKESFFSTALVKNPIINHAWEQSMESYSIIKEEHDSH